MQVDPDENNSPDPGNILANNAPFLFATPDYIFWPMILNEYPLLTMPPSPTSTATITGTPAHTPTSTGSATPTFTQPPAHSPTPTATFTITPTPSNTPLPPWTNLFSETFEGTFPGEWSLYSYWFNGTEWQNVTSAISWGKRTCQANSGSNGGWAVGGGTYGSALQCMAGYADNIETWMVYGPIDLSQIKDGYISIKLWLDIENNYDFVGWGVSLDNVTVYGNAFTGYSGSWFTDTMDLKDVYTLGNITGQPQVWIAIWFASNPANPRYYEGIAIDDLVLSTCSSLTTCSGSPAVTGFTEIPEAFEQRTFSRKMRKD
ncbi:MAG: hypothetical protein WA109_03935 [Bellilinea sp.]